MRRTNPGNLLGTLAPAALVFLVTCNAAAGGFTETLPRGAWMLDVNYTYSWLNAAWDNDGNKGPLVDKIYRYEPGTGLQGILTPYVDVTYQLIVTQLQFGILDDLTLGIGIPVILSTTVSPKFQWEPGDYMGYLGRAFSENDFWQWAGSMGQPKPGNWSGNYGALSDIVLGIRWRFSDRIKQMKDSGFNLAFMLSGALPTGQPAFAEAILASGSASWDLNSQGELNFHLSADKTFKKELDDRLTLGLDLFYEVFFPHSYPTPTGVMNPLLLNYAPYVGAHYTLNPGDFLGFSFQVDVVAAKGPAYASWISGHDKTKAETYPGLLSLSMRYTFTYLFQSDWQSDSSLWDWDREKLWRPGYKNALFAKLTMSFMRLGVPLQIYGAYKNLSLIPGKNTRSTDVVSAGIQLFLKFW
jgi:hypothetical protein